VEFSFYQCLISNFYSQEKVEKVVKVANSAKADQRKPHNPDQPRLASNSQWEEFTDF
jgi:hypothetical protein